jgi:hypothetical protein
VKDDKPHGSQGVYFGVTSSNGDVIYLKNNLIDKRELL